MPASSMARAGFVPGSRVTWRAHKSHPLPGLSTRHSTPVETVDPVLLSRKVNECAYVDEVTKGLAQGAALVTWLVDPPTGAVGLQAMLGAKAGS